MCLEVIYAECLNLAVKVTKYFDKDKKGNYIARKPSNIFQQLALNIGARKLVDEDKKNKKNNK